MLCFLFSELQLKPNHCPAQLFGKWTTYLRKYTVLSDKAAQSQLPLVHLRRNVYISRDEDSKVSHLSHKKRVIMLDFPLDSHV